MPVAIPPIDWQVRPVSLQLRLQRGNQVTALLVDWTLALEVVIVLSDRQHALTRNVPSTQHVFQEGNHFFPRFRSTERDHQNGVVVHGETNYRDSTIEIGSPGSQISCRARWPLRMQLPHSRSASMADPMRYPSP